MRDEGNEDDDIGRMRIWMRDEDDKDDERGRTGLRM